MTKQRMILAGTAVAAVVAGAITFSTVRASGDEESYYEVEVTLDDGARIDVQLDEQFAVVSVDADAEEPGDAD